MEYEEIYKLLKNDKISYIEYADEEKKYYAKLKIYIKDWIECKIINKDQYKRVVYEKKEFEKIIKEWDQKNIKEYYPIPSHPLFNIDETIISNYTILNDHDIFLYDNRYNHFNNYMVTHGNYNNYEYYGVIDLDVKYDNEDEEIETIFISYIHTLLKSISKEDQKIVNTILYNYFMELENNYPSRYYYSLEDININEFNLIENILKEENWSDIRDFYEDILNIFYGIPEIIEKIGAD